MAAAEMRAAWHRTAATCYLLHEDSKRTSKVGNPPSETSDGQKGTKLEQQQNLGKIDDHAHLLGLSEGWSTINSHYFMDRKIDFHFEPTDMEAEKLSEEVAMESEGSKSGHSGWETVEAPCSSTVGTVEEKVALEGPDKPILETDPKRIQQQQQVLKKLENVCLESSGSTWRNANKGELAALIAKKSSEDMENCDLPSKGFQAKVDAGRFSQGKVTLSALQSREGMHSSSLHFASHGIGDKKNTVEFCKSKKLRQEQDQRSEDLPHWTTLVPEGKSELLGEALCRSQTRAREAEKRAAEAVVEKERLVKLFFREASISLTYRHWVKFLEIENKLLRLQAGEDVNVAPEEKNAETVESATVVQQQSSKVPFSKDCNCIRGRDLAKCTRLKKRKHSDHSVAVLGCTVGLAFALGVGLAGAGLLFGCTMGWILIAF